MDILPGKSTSESYFPLSMGPYFELLHFRHIPIIFVGGVTCMPWNTGFQEVLKLSPLLLSKG